MAKVKLNAIKGGRGRPSRANAKEEEVINIAYRNSPAKFVCLSSSETNEEEMQNNPEVK